MTRFLPLALLSMTLACGLVTGEARAEPADAPAAAPRVAPPPEGKGQVVFFRKTSMGGMPYAFTIKDRDVPVTKLTNGRYFVYVTDPGEHEFKVRAESKDVLFLEVEPGETYYVEQTMVMGMFYYANMAPSTEAAFNAAKLRPGTAAEP